MMAPVLNSIAQVSAERLLDSLVEGAALAVFAALLLRLIPRQNAATRFAVWFSVILGAILLPLFGGWASAPAVSPAHALFTVPATWAEYLAVAWILAVCIALARFAHGLLELRRLRSRCRPVILSQLDPLLRNTLDRFRAVRPVALLLSDDVEVPTAIGFVKPAVVLPSEVVDEMSPAELNHVLLHELAHLRRRDDWTNIVLQIVKCVLFFHPAVWWAERRIALEREMACDDAVLAETGSAHAYAACLTRLAERNFLRRTAAFAQAAVSRVRQATVARIARILESKTTPKPAKFWAFSLVTGFAALCLVIAAQGPQLVSFAAPHKSVAKANTAASEVPSDVHYAAVKPPISSQVVLAVAVDRSRDAISAPRTVKTPRPVQAKQHLVVHKPGVLQASMTDVNVPAPPVLLVYYAQVQRGAFVWRICIWQVTVSTEPGQVRKSI